MASVSPITSSERDIASASRDPIARVFAGLRSAGRRALIPYVTAGYPDRARTVDLLHALDGSGADIIELGVPFSDPVADGPTIQRSSQRALEQGMTLRATLDALRAFRERSNTPVVLFSYLNPVVGVGVSRFIEEAVDAGAQGVLLTDLPAGGDPALERQLLDSPLSLIRLAAPTTDGQRMRRITADAQGFLYYVGRLGVTGAGAALRTQTLDEVAALRERIALPVAVGFGVSTPAHAADIAAVADGVIVGSALIDALDRGGVDAAAALLQGMRIAMDEVG